MALLREPGVTDRRPLLPDLEAEEARFRRRERAFAEEPGLRPGADLELELRPADDRAQIDVIPRGKAWRILVRARLPLRRVARGAGTPASAARSGRDTGGRIDVRAGPVKVC